MTHFGAGAFESLRMHSRPWLQDSKDIIDYHTHLPVGQLADNEPLQKLSSFWVAPDHYKLRVLRHLGMVANTNQLEGGSQSLSEMWLSALPQTVGSPLFEWSKLELEIFFGWSLEKAIDSPKKFIAEADELLSSDAGRPQALLRSLGVTKIATSDDPSSTLDSHSRVTSGSMQVSPTFRIDNILHIDHQQTFDVELKKLAICESVEIADLASLLQALKSSHNRFHGSGCRLSDAGVFSVQATPGMFEIAEVTMAKSMRGEKLSSAELLNWQRVILDSVADWSKSLGWTLQLHFGASRNINKRLFLEVGKDSGGDAMGFPNPDSLSSVLGDWAERDSLPRTVIYVSNPAHSAPIATLCLVFFREGIEGLVRLGPAWWFLDSRAGIRQNIETQAEIGVLGQFPGMVSDSRSFFSGIRHLYFRDELYNFFHDGVRRGNFSWGEIHDSNVVNRILQENPDSIFNGVGAETR